MPLPQALHSQPESERPTMREATSMYLRPERTALQEALVQTDALALFRRGDRGQGCLGDREGDRDTHSRMALLSVQRNDTVT